MKKNVGFYAVICCFIVTSQTIFGQQHIVELPISPSKNILVRITEPDNFSKDKTYPILIAPGLDDANLNAGFRYSGKNPGQYGWILVESLVHIQKRNAAQVLVEYLNEKYPDYPLYILGFSANSIDAFQIAETYHDKFAGVIGMPGNPDIGNLNKLTRFTKTKILMIVGERDIYWKNRAINAKRKLDELKIQNTLIVVPKGGHVLDEMTGPPLFEALNRFHKN